MVGPYRLVAVLGEGGMGRASYISGPSLQYAVAEHGPLSVETTLNLVAKVAKALQSVHAAGVIHRDLKPSNMPSYPGPAPYRPYGG